MSACRTILLVFLQVYGYSDLPENQCQMRRTPQTTTSNSDTTTHNAGRDTLSESSDEDVSILELNK